MNQSELVDAYRKTHYCVLENDQVHRLVIGETSIYAYSLLVNSAGNDACGAIFITAWNPFSEPMDAHQNHEANLCLRTDLLTRRLWLRNGVGKSPDGDWSEDSFLAWPINRSEALELCLRYKQNAVVFVDKSGVAELLLHPNVKQ